MTPGIRRSLSLMTAVLGVGGLALAQSTSTSPSPGGLPVTYERLLKTTEEPGNWLTYNGDYRSHHYSTLKQITAENVHGLRAKWIYQMHKQKVESTPIVVDGVMYVTRPPSDLIALDAETGRALWTYEHRLLPGRVYVCCGEVNRGVAILGSTLFLSTLDAKLIALDARAGRVLWKRDLADPSLNYTATGAPLAIKDKVIVGIAGAEGGIRGFLDAYDARTGERAWRFWTIPAPGEPGAETWVGESWRYGGGSTWLTGSYDPDLNLLYWGTGNPGPDYNGDVRPGDNLYSCSLLALDPDTGTLKWHFQLTPHDTRDWDATQVPVLLDAAVDGRLRKLVVMPSRNGFYYALDRQSGEFLFAKPFVKQTWAKEIDKKGRPIVNPARNRRQRGMKRSGLVSTAGTTGCRRATVPTRNCFTSTRERNGAGSSRPTLLNSGPAKRSSAGAGAVAPGSVRKRAGANSSRCRPRPAISSGSTAS